MAQYEIEQHDGFTVEEIPVPTTLEGPAGDDFRATIEVRTAVEVLGYGTDDVAYPAEEILPGWLREHEPHRLIVARVDGRIVARGVYETRLGEAADTTWLDVDVLPDFVPLGIEDAVADRLEGLARADGRRKAIFYQVSPDGPGERLAPPTGFGSVPADNHEVRFLLGRGFRLEQVERASRFPLPGDEADLAGRQATAQDAAGPDYAVRTWTGPTPEQWRDDMSLLLTRMSTDAPTAGLEEPEDAWDAERLVASEAVEATMPLTLLTAVAEHLPTGRLAGFTKLGVPVDVARPVSQWDTIVLREHRGHRLGMLLKVANLRHLAEAAPGHPSVLTWNAEENRHMLSVNEAVGFVPIGYEGAWRKDL